MTTSASGGGILAKFISDNYIVLVGVGYQQSLSVTITASGGGAIAEFVSDNYC